MKQYIGKDKVIVSAIQWTGKNVEEILDSFDTGTFQKSGDVLQIERMGYTTHVEAGRWVLLDPDQRFYSIESESFDVAYEEYVPPVEPDSEESVDEWIDPLAGSQNDEEGLDTEKL